MRSMIAKTLCRFKLFKPSERYLSTGVGRPKKEWQRKQIGHHKPLTKCVFPKKCDPEILHLVGKPTLVIWWTSTKQNQRKVLRETQCHTPTIGGWFLLRVGLVQPLRLFDCHEQIYICCMVFTVHSCFSTFWGLYELPLFSMMEEWVWSLTCVVILFCWVTFLYKPACPNIRNYLRKKACWKLLEKDKIVASRVWCRLLQNEKSVDARARWNNAKQQTVITYYRVRSIMRCFVLALITYAYLNLTVS